MTADVRKTVVVVAAPTGPTGTYEGVHIILNRTGPTGGTGHLPEWIQATGATGPHGGLQRVYNIPVGISGTHKTVTIQGFVGATGS